MFKRFNGNKANVYLNRVILKNFKSFKEADIGLTQGVNAFAGPNGSGKSNVCDAIRFILGETSLKAMRVDSTKHLINYGSQSANVEVTFLDGEEKLIVSREIEKEGATTFRLNGKKITGKDLQNFIIKKGLYSPKRVVIGQGEISKVAELKPKELREYIDDLAGISEYEMKRQEAIRELESADVRIKEANLVLGEKLKFLDELKAEMDRAEEYFKMKKELDDIKFTLIFREIERIKQEENRLNQRKEENIVSKDEIEARISDIRAKIQKIMDDRTTTNKELEEKMKRNELFKQIEQLKADVAVKRESIRGFDEKEAMIREQLASINAELSSFQTKAVDLDAGIKQSKSEASSINIDKVKKEDEKLGRIMAEMEAKEKKAHSLDIEIASSSSAIEKDREMQNVKEGMLNDLISQKQGSATESVDLEKELKRIEKDSMDLFQKEKSLNNLIADSDKKTIKLRERIAIMRASAGTQKVNPALHFVDELKSSGKIEGIYGKVIDLIHFDEKFAEAVEASASARLNYVVVSDLNVAKQVVDYLKEARVGRVTIIPLGEIRANVSNIKEGIGMLRTFVSSDILFSKVIDYVFGDTILVNSFEDGKRLHGRYRTVTMDGTLFEASGVLTGGKSTTNFAMNKALSSAEQELDIVRAERENYISQLKDVKERFSSNREKKVQIETKLSAMNTDGKEQKGRINIDQLKDDVFKARSSIAEKERKIGEMKSLLQELGKEMEKLRAEKEKLLQRMNIEEDDYNKKTLEKTSLKAMLLERAKNQEKEREETLSRIPELQKEMKTLEDRISEIGKERRLLSDTLRMKEGELVFKETEFGKSGQLLNDLMARINRFEKELQELGGEEKSLTDKLSKVEREIGKADIELASVGTRIEDLERSIETYKSSSLLEEGRIELEKRLKELEERLSGTQSINFAAKETYYRLYDDVGEIKERLDKLKIERDSIMLLMEEINKRKKEAFFDTLANVKKNFESIFSNLKHFGTGTLELDNNEDPFESGLHIKVIRNDKSISLHALSGGEKTIVSLMFIFSMLFVRPSPIYVLDEIDAALDKLNSERMIDLIRGISKSTQFLLVSHNEIVLSKCDVIVGVAKTKIGSKIIEVRNKQDTVQ